MASEDFLSRWSRRKSEARKGEPVRDVPEAPKAPPPAPAPEARPPVAAAESRPAAEEGPVLPSLESLTADSDFAPFMQPGVDAGLRRQALKKLLHDPRFNVMDGLDVYIDDYTKADPLPEGWLEQLNQVARLGEREPQPAEAPEREPLAHDSTPAATPAESAPAAPTEAGEDSGEAFKAPVAESNPRDPV